MQAFLNGMPIAADVGARGKTPFGLPPWATELPGGRFSGLVLDNNDLFLVAVHQQKLKDGRTFSLMSSLPVDGAALSTVADGLGHASLLPERAGSTSNDAKARIATQMRRSPKYLVSSPREVTTNMVQPSPEAGLGIPIGSNIVALRLNARADFDVLE